MTFNINDIQHKWHSALGHKRHYAEYGILFIVMPSVFMQNAIMLSVIMLSVEAPNILIPLSVLTK